MKNHRRLSLMVLLCLLLSPLAAQSRDDGGSAGSSAAGDSGSYADGEGPELPASFRDIRLGMGLEELKDALTADSYFHFRGDRDVSFLPAREETLIETTGFSFIRRAFFQLREGRLFIMAFTLDTSLIDHYSVFTEFVKKYGEPDSLNPRESVWNSQDTRLSIERPLTVKYIDLEVFDQLIEESKVGESGEAYLRKEFLDGF